MNRPGCRSAFQFGAAMFGFLLFGFAMPAAGQKIACVFDQNNYQFVGSPLEQARCLLRPVKPGGVLGEPLIHLPKPLESLIGMPSKISKEKLRKYLTNVGIAESVLGGSLDDPLCAAKLPNRIETAALYFLIHDTSTPNYLLDGFPADINESTWRFNDLQMWLTNPVAHIFVNRLGESITTTPFNEPVRKGFGTKFAREVLMADAKGLQIHIELVLPRRSDPGAFNGNDIIAPLPGFTRAQYQRLALLYLIAAARRGSWLIPSYHCAMDAGIKDGHDDPQNFDLEIFAKELTRLITQTK